jgi:hypothetical protein
MERKPKKRLAPQALAPLPHYKRWLREIPAQTPRPRDDLRPARGIINATLGMVVVYAVLAVILLTAGCGGGGAKNDAKPSNTTPPPAAPSTPPAPSGGYSPPPPPADFEDEETSPGWLGAGWLAKVSPSGPHTRGGGVCFADYPRRNERGEFTEPLLLCADTLDYSAFIAARYVSRSGWSWRSVDGNVRGEIWHWPLTDSGTLRGDRLTVGTYPLQPGLGQPGLEFTLRNGGAAPYEMEPRGARYALGAASLVGTHEAFCNREPCAVEITTDGTLRATTASCETRGTFTGNLSGVVRGTLTHCDGREYTALAGTVPRSVNSATGADWSRWSIAVLGYHGSKDQFVIANASTPRTPVAYVPPAPPPPPPPPPPGSIEDPTQPAPLAPLISAALTASAATVTPGSDVVLSWESSGDFCLASWGGAVAPIGSDTLRMTTPRVFEIECNLNNSPPERAARASASVDVADDSPGCEATNSCEPLPLVIEYAGTWANESALCMFAAGGSFYCTEARAGRRAIFEGTFSSVGTANVTSCWLDGGAPFSGEVAASIDVSAAPIRLGVYLSPEFSWPEMRPAAPWENAPRCAP